MCQQAIEKVLKAIYVQQKNDVPPKIHNLKLLLDKTCLLDALDDETDTIMEALLSFYLGSRYPDKRQRLVAICSEEHSKTLSDKVKQVIIWLKSKL